MNFFQRQRQAKRKTTWLVVLFLLASLCIIAIVDIVALWFLGGPPEGAGENWVVANGGLLIAASMITALVILGASAYKIASLNAGGGVVARSLGAKPVPPEPNDFPQQQLRNVVEEVAIASGMPVPEIYVLEQETAINAFAAGNSPADAAVAVTRGAMERLSRDELQGVIAHEFSHVGNGDMRLNLKLMGWVFGILILALAGRMMLYSGGRSREGKALVMVGLALMLAGYVGLFFGRLIKAAVSRERERLADASAVQFTRNPVGLAGALKKIGGYEAGSKLTNADVEEVSHMLFASSLSGWFSSLYATHPPLIERIRILEPTFNPKDFEHVAQAPGPTPGEAERTPASQVAGLAPAALAAAVGQPEPGHLRAGQSLHRLLPPELRTAARDGDQAGLLVAAMVLDDRPDVRDPQQAVLVRELGESDSDRILTWSRALSRLEVSARLPLLALAWPALRALPPERLNRLARVVSELARADGQVTLFEYVLARNLRVLVSDLSGADPGGGRLKPRHLHRELGDVFSVLAAAGHHTDAEARRAFNAGMVHLLGPNHPEFRLPQDWQGAMDLALDKLDRLKPLSKGTLVEALAITCAHDEVLKVAEVELLRSVCFSVHCPMPPLPFNES